MNSSPTPTNSSTVARRQIREAAIQLLHSSQSNTHQAEGTGDPWPLILAQPEGKITRTRARAVLHLQQNRPGRFKPIWEQRMVVQPLLETYYDDRAANRSYRKLLEAEQKLPDLLDILRRQLKSEKEPDRIEETLLKIRDFNKEALDQGSVLSDFLGPLESCPEPLKPLASKLPALLAAGELLRSLFAEKLPEIPEVKALLDAIDERNQLRNETEALYKLVVDNLPATDKLIAEQLENFSLERLAQVDRAVLRLATTELHHCPDIPPAVSINEAIEIARRYSGTESAGFVNGILDKLKS
ncbi:transcription antitermination factor NusB [Roseibacillus persicicus]|uniref:NusB/RsmB/TIM44 domain-containing protein n=1 Tax=Roseibacillus persicicus TaxID=454148 RepID=A0A918TH47_9BACT|nr:transcription antitermination factor NusB [Roseibacillus persicicus]GHC47622.1 hypothetical protein GCM10007100_11730 [Roseibacillus persicicus]